MSGKRKVTIGVAALAVLGGIIAAVQWRARAGPITLRGAVIRADADPIKQLPIADVEVTAARGPTAVKSDASGLFRLTLNRGIKPGQAITLRFRRPGYLPLDLTEVVGDKLYVARLTPIPQPAPAEPNRPAVVIANVSVRYSEKTTTALNVGSAVKTFQVVNRGNVPCDDRPPCSPNGKWKAAIGSVSVDAGEGNEFRNARVSCIAGPCPFTRIESDNFSRGGRNISVSVRNWSDTTTFLLEAEVLHPMVSELIRKTYPVIFGRVLNFSLPPEAEGPSIEAELNGADIVFPLGPDLCLSWAKCSTRVDQDQTRIFRCELEPGFRF